MIPFDEAVARTMHAARPMTAQRVTLRESLHRVLAEDVVCDVDMPPFDKSAMDGYACRREDLGKELAIVETIPAGRAPTRAVAAGQCAKIMTGAMVPRGADCVVMVEHTTNPTPETMRFTGKDTKDNICNKAEDVRAGDVVLPKGERITPARIATLASAGCARPLVSRPVRVGIIATGDEIVEPGEPVGPTQIRNSNGHQLVAQVERMGAEPRYHGIARDTEDSIDAAVQDASAAGDVVLLTGGVSMGDFDLVPGVLARNGFEILFEKVATKPGKPTVFGVSDGAVCFGLPGNPVSAFVIFEVLVKPFLFKMMGHDHRPWDVRGRLTEAVTRKKTQRLSWVPVSLTEAGGVRPLNYHGSGHIHALSFADGLISIPVGVAQLPAGAEVEVRQI